MLIRILLPFLILLLLACETKTTDEKENHITPFEDSEGQISATYEQTIAFYMELARDYPQIHIQTIGDTDSGYPLHLVSFNREADFNFQKLSDDKTIILILNAIHPGESDGIDASMMLFRDLAKEVVKTPENIVLVTIPIYNVGGSMNRSQKTRVNQNGPDVHGFRGNARNYDLNRDFIKADTKNTRTFTEIFHLVKPDIFIDTHVSNGADYQYTLTHLFTQHNKLGGSQGRFLEDEMIPALESGMAQKGEPITPYVNIFNRPPDRGFSQFLDYPRYSSGYASLWATVSLMIETHMLKSYDKRVKTTYDFLAEILNFSDERHEEIKLLREEADSIYQTWRSYPLKWGIDSLHYRELEFRGFRADTIPSLVTGKDRLKYNREEPINKKIPYYNNYIALDSISIPSAYLIGREWQKVIDLLTLNQIHFTPLEQDTIIEVEAYRIADYKTYRNSYEGHYPHYDTQTITETVEVKFQEGDILIPTNQYGIRYLLEVLEPMAADSFFNWNFFDTILQQKEGFSPYVFEELAYELLESNAILRDSFERKKDLDEAFNEDAMLQLQWIYQHSEYYENAHMQYPVYRLMNNDNLTDANGDR